MSWTLGVALLAPVRNSLDYGLRSDFVTDLTDQTGKTWTAYGAAAVSSGALQLASAGDYLDTPYHADFHFTTSQDVTIRGKVAVPSFGSGLKVLLTTRKDPSGARNWSIYATPNGIRFFVWGAGTTLVDNTWSSIFTAGTEFEWSLERKGMIWYLYVNGSQVSGTVTQSSDYGAYTSSELTIGSETNAGGGTSRDLAGGSLRYLQIIKNKAMGNGGSTTPTI